MARVTVGPEGLQIDGEPALIQAGVLHYAHLPHPDLWRPLLERMRMGGLNAVVVPFPWAYHAPAPGFHDFTGPRAVDRLLDEVARVGLWLIPHVGPWISPHLDAGGLPAWLFQAGVSLPACSDAEPHEPSPAFLRHVETWWRRLFAYLRNQANLTFALLDPGRCASGVGLATGASAYGRALYELARRLGMDCPCGLPNVIWHPDGGPEPADALSSGVAPSLSVAGYHAMEPRPTTAKAETVKGTDFLILNDFSPFEDARSPEGARFVLLDLAASAVSRDSSRRSHAHAMNADHPRALIARAVADDIRLIGLSPYHAGLNWGWWSAPGSITRYGQGAPVAEAGALPDAYYRARRMSLTLETMGDVLRAPDAASSVHADPPALLLGAQSGRYGTLVCLRNGQRVEDFAGVTLERGTRQVTIEDIAVPADTTRLIPINWRIAGRRLVGATLEPVLHTSVAGRELLILLNEVGGEVLLPADFRPRHRRGPVYIEKVTFAGAQSGLAVHFDPARLASLVLDGPEGVLQILALEPSWANRVWPLDDLWRVSPAPAPEWRPSDEAPAAGVVIGPDLVLPEEDGGFRFLASDKGFGYRWGPWRGSDPHTWLAPLWWQAPPQLELPADLVWSSQPGAPEALPDYDDRGWRRLAPAEPMDMETLGVNHGFIWYRGHFAGDAQAVTVAARHACDLYLNGSHIATLNPPPDLGPVAPKTLPIPRRHLRDNNVLAIVVENMGREASWDRAQAPHGLTTCTVEGPPSVDWRARGGLSGEMRVQGFEGYADWDLVPQDGARDISWHRATFNLDLPEGVEAPIFLELDQTPSKVYVYLNGHLVGRMVYPQGTQRRFWLPEGLLDRRGENELLIAQWTRGGRPSIGLARLTAGTAQVWRSEAGPQG